MEYAFCPFQNLTAHGPYKHSYEKSISHSWWQQPKSAKEWWWLCWKLSAVFSSGAVILVERQPVVKNENLRRAYRPQIKIPAQEQVRQCERSWLKLCKWQRVHSEWQLFLRRLRWLIKGFHLPLTEINHSTHTHTLSLSIDEVQRERSTEIRCGWQWNDRGCSTLLGERSPPAFCLLVSLSKALFIPRVTLFLWATGGHRLLLELSVFEWFWM